MLYRLLFCLIVALSALTVQGQAISPKAPADSADDKEYLIIEQQPYFPGGNRAMMRFIANNVKYPIWAAIFGIEGKVKVSFLVNADGSISEIEVIESTSKRFNQTSIDVIKMMPKWQPGTINGKVVKARITIPINYRLAREE